MLRITFVVAAGLAAGAMLGGCAAADPPTATISAADVAVRSAREAGAHQRAALELRKAEEDLQAAREAVDDEEMTDARRHAEKALVEARLAEEKAEAVQAQRRADDAAAGIETLKKEVQP